MNSVYIVDAVRTAVGKYAGMLANARPDDMAAHVIKALMKRNPHIDFNQTEEVILGAANQSGEDNRNVARMASLLAGLPPEVSGVTVNRLCASSLHAIADAFLALSQGYGDLYIAGGVESMSRAPFVMAKAEKAFDRVPEIYDTTIGWRFTNPALAAMHYPFTMGETAENVADKWKLTREEQDLFAYNSQLKWDSANKAGKFKDEITPYEIKGKKDTITVFDTDEHPRISSVDVLATLKPAFKKGGSVTAGNSSGINDGASVLALASEKFVNTHQLKPMARIVSFAAAGVAPEIMGVGPIPATQKALKRGGLQVKDIDLIELNEAFASQSIVCINELELNPEIVNVNGGSIAIGHPLGASGARITTTLLHEMTKRQNMRYGLATMCVGVGQGMALIVEKV
ncbi:MAG: acetyl-CoA C-acyltransferase [Bacteroidia bacterium]|nr:acetyl-CoA C-acyltransferase [Bacteroidia bacterium]MCO5254874.1 acetyl-CoA C-acyltransferase [Bacteroidota bacterium]MCZ2128951.1 acetyl-CoA C-acyltransferase [Bacteroidia bacterium]